MGSCSMQNHEKWLIKAENDPNAAKVLCKANYLDVAIYHTQQCAEKALKGFLVWKKHSLVKTHDLVALVAMCKKYNLEFAAISTLAEKLTPFGFIFRYPDVETYQTKQVVLTAISEAGKILRFIENQILE